MAPILHGILVDPKTGPLSGERVEQLLCRHGAVVEQILSGDVDGPVDYEQDHDEWVLLLAGRADLEIDGEMITMGPGSWVLLPGHVPHRLVAVAPGSNWLALHLPRD